MREVERKCCGDLEDFEGVLTHIYTLPLSSPSQRRTTFLFSKTNGSLYSGPTYFFLFLSAVLEFLFLLPSERYTSIGEVTQIPCSQPHLLRSWDSSRFPLASAWPWLWSLLTGIYSVIILLLAPGSHSLSPSISWVLSS